MSPAQAELALPAPPTFSQPKGGLKRVCGRDPAAGPGTCWFWWEGCPKAAKRGCYLLWLSQQPESEDAAV